ncbi:MAG TPA: ribonuclease Z, partial [Nitrososphaera sp.]|nr:ribonuclease Z [Nitrososphaera sp.]
DAGEGMQRNFIKAGLGMNRKTKIFITHMHSDHCVGLLGLLQTMSLQGRTAALDVFGQPRLKEFIEENMRIINFGLGYEVNIHTIEKEGIVDTEDEYQVTCCDAVHSIPALSYCVEEFDRPGVFDIAKVKSLGVPEGSLYGQLQRGEDVLFEGRTIRSSEVVGPPRRGRKICFSGDTRPSSKLEKFFQDAEILIFESTYSDDMHEKAIQHWHSTATEAASIAKAARVKKLFLTHFSARYDETANLVREAQKIHECVEAAEDLKTVPIPYPK